MLSFNTDGMVPQRFAFQDPIMDYFFKNLKPEHLIKLYQCCKYFYAKFHRNIIRHLKIVPDELNIAECLNFPVEYGYDMYAPVESIIAEVPNAKSIEISNALFNEKSCEALLSINHNVKFSKFVLRVKSPLRFFKFELFKEFILKNAEPECHVQMDFKLLDEDDVEARLLNEVLLELGKYYSKRIKSDLEIKNKRE
uniref:Uncharacterized protein n=1 Tax=Panagrolaimus sp. PS1159 TaxID=55785 RepID=A0AC35FQD9_9BILA